MMQGVSALWRCYAANMRAQAVTLQRRKQAKERARAQDVKEEWRYDHVR